VADFIIRDNIERQALCSQAFDKDHSWYYNFYKKFVFKIDQNYHSIFLLGPDLGDIVDKWLLLRGGH